MGAITEIQEPDDRPTKRQRLSRPSLGQQTSRASRIFAPYRTVGLVSPSQVPFTAQALGKTTFHITTSAGNCLQSYDLRRGLNLVFITRPQTPGPITATASWADKVLAAWSTGGSDVERGIWIFKRGKKVGEIVIPLEVKEDVVEIVVFGSWLLGCCATAIQVWESSTLEPYATIWPPFSGSRGNILTGGLVTMPAFTNKVLAGREDGTVEIWNVSTGRLLYRILPPDSGVGAVSALQPTPVLSYLAIAYANGLVTIHDIRADQQILSVHAGQTETCPITSISFRTDGLGAGPDGQQDGIMATASFGSGDVTLWDLNNGGRKAGVMRAAHRAPDAAGGAMAGGVSKVEFLSNQAVLVTSGADNALRTWIFDRNTYSPLPRALHSRGGHAAPVTTLNFLPVDVDGSDSTGKWLLSTSKDKSLWGWSLRRDGQSTELSQGAIEKKAKAVGLGKSGQSSTPADLKAPEIHCLACQLNRDGGIGAQAENKTLWASAKQLKGKSTATEQNITGWESIVTGHVGDSLARTWYWGRKRAGRWALETGDGGHVESVAISPCGTFALVGSALGGIDMFNLQSGLHRQRFPPRLTPQQAKRLATEQESRMQNGESEAQQHWARGQGKHTKAVTGVEVDSLNSTVISCGLDGRVKFWDFLTGHLLYELDWHATTAVKGMRYHRPSNLIAFSCTDSAIRIVDIETRKIVRELHGSTTKILDWCFSNDGRWIIASDADAVIRVWDLPTGHLIDAMRLPRPCTALAFSNTGEYLATAQQEGVGIDVWTNRTLFTHVPTRPITEDEVTDVAAPTASGEGGEGVISAALGEELNSAEEAILDSPAQQLEQLGKDIETLSLVPKSRWQTLLHLEAIRQRNKPTEPPKAPEKAPFFLPSLEGPKSSLDMSLVPSDETKDQRSVARAMERSRILHTAPQGMTNMFSILLEKCTPSAPASYAAFIDHLKTLSPSATDVEVRSLNTAAPYTDLSRFAEALTHRLRERKDYELVQTWMTVFLRIHGDVLGDAVEAEGDGNEDEDGPRLVRVMKEWRAEQKSEQKRLGELTGYCIGVSTFLRSGR